MAAEPAPPAPPPPPPARELPASAIQYLEPPAPAYPRASRRLGESGLVIVRVFVDADGMPRQLQIAQSSGFVRLDDAALEGVRRGALQAAHRERPPDRRLGAHPDSLRTGEMNVNAESTLGFGHFIAQSDAVGKTLLVVLVAMSVLSWIIIAIKGLTLAVRKRRSTAFLNFFWNATSLDAVAHEIATHGAHDPFSHLTSHAMQAQTHHARYGAAKLEEAGSASDFVTRTIKKVLDEETTRLENGLAVLATVGATAPFVGLFGTVWGVYHALVAIGMSGAGTLDKVAGPGG